MAGSTLDLSYTESEQFALNFPIVMAAVSNYMVTEYNEGRLKDVNYATVQAQAIQSAIQTTLTLTMQTDSQQAQTDLLKQQKLTEAQRTIVETNQGSKILSDIAISNEQSAKDILVKTQQITSMIKEDDVKMSQKAMLDQQKLTLS